MPQSVLVKQAASPTKSAWSPQANSSSPPQKNTTSRSFPSTPSTTLSTNACAAEHPQKSNRSGSPPQVAPFATPPSPTSTALLPNRHSSIPLGSWASASLSTQPR